MDIDHLSSVLQASIAPCVLISGLGLLLLSMTNRLARPIDRARSLNNELKKNLGADTSGLEKQIVILYKRCRLLQMAIGLITVSVFFLSIIILMLFSTYIFNLNISLMIQALFTLSLVCTILSLVYFFMDIRLTLNSLKLEIGKYIDK